MPHLSDESLKVEDIERKIEIYKQIDQDEAKSSVLYRRSTDKDLKQGTTLND